MTNIVQELRDCAREVADDWPQLAAVIADGAHDIERLHTRVVEQAQRITYLEHEFNGCQAANIEMALEIGRLRAVIREAHHILASSSTMASDDRVIVARGILLNSRALEEK